MAQDYGIQAPSRTAPRPPLRDMSRYLVLIDSAAEGRRVARLFGATRKQVAEFDPASPEVLSLIDGRRPLRHAGAARWNAALAGHSADERATAEVYVLAL